MSAGAKTLVEIVVAVVGGVAEVVAELADAVFAENVAQVVVSEVGWEVSVEADVGMLVVAVLGEGEV